MSNEVVSDWRVATYTGGQGNCVEVGRSATAVAVRDTKDRQGGPVLRFDQRDRNPVIVRTCRRKGVPMAALTTV
jgi:hypothetical protein